MWFQEVQAKNPLNISRSTVSSSNLVPVCRHEQGFSWAITPDDYSTLSAFDVWKIALAPRLREWDIDVTKILESDIIFSSPGSWLKEPNTAKTGIADTFTPVHR